MNAEIQEKFREYIEKRNAESKRAEKIVEDCVKGKLERDMQKYPKDVLTDPVYTKLGFLLAITHAQPQNKIAIYEVKVDVLENDLNSISSRTMNEDTYNFLLNSNFYTIFAQRYSFDDNAFGAGREE